MAAFDKICSGFTQLDEILHHIRLGDNVVWQVSDAVARIRDTTQLLLDVFSNENVYYIRPLKVWNRYSDQMFLPHCYRKDSGEISTLQGGVAMSRYYLWIGRQRRFILRWNKSISFPREM